MSDITSSGPGYGVSPAGTPAANIVPQAGTGALNGAKMDFSGSTNAPVYMQDAAGALDAYNTALANTATKRQSLYNQEGFKTQTDAQGNIINYSVDGLNPTGAYQQLQRKEGQQLEAQHEVDASRGIGGNGIAQQNTSNLRYANGVEQANFGNNFLAQDSGLTDANAQAFSQYQNTLLNLQLQSIADARTNQTFPNEGGTADGSGAPGSPGNPVSAKNSIGGVTSTGQLQDIANQYGLTTNGKQGPGLAPAPSAKSPAISPSQIQAAMALLNPTTKAKGKSVTIPKFYG